MYPYQGHGNYYIKRFQYKCLKHVTRKFIDISKYVYKQNDIVIVS